MSDCVSIDQDSLNQLRGMISDMSVIADRLGEAFAAERPTLRDYFAARALEGYLAGSIDAWSRLAGTGVRVESATPERIAVEAFRLADAMLVEARQPKGATT